MTPSSRVVLLAGSSGLLGRNLAAALRARQWQVRRLVRRPARGADEITWDPAAGRLAPEALQGVDAIVNLGGAGLGDHRWTDSYRETIRSSRLQGTALLAETIAREQERRREGQPDVRPLRYLQASAVGYYGDRGEEQLLEQSSPGDGFLADLCRDWEAATRPATDAGASVALLRTGIVLAPRGGALGPMLPLLRLGLAGPLGGGRQWWPWLTLHDHIRAQLHLLDSDRRGPVNLASPRPARQGEVIRSLAHALHRPAVLPVPRFALRIVLGPFADDVLASQLMVPGALTEDGFGFDHAELDAASGWVARHITRTG